MEKVAADTHSTLPIFNTQKLSSGRGTVGSGIFYMVCAEAIYLWDVESDGTER
jgi:hypothetical protein